MYSLSLRFVLPAFLPFLLAETGTEYFGTYFYKMQSPENGTGVSVLSVGEAGNLLQCTRQCLVTPGCDKEAYHRSNKTCILAGDETMGTLVVDMDVQDEDWVYYTSNLQNTSVNQVWLFDKGLGVLFVLILDGFVCFVLSVKCMSSFASL